MKASGVNSGKNGRRGGGDMAVVDPFFFFFFFDPFLKLCCKEKCRNGGGLEGVMSLKKNFCCFHHCCF